MVEENQCSDQIPSQIESDKIEAVAVVSTSEVEGLGDSGTVLLYVYMQMFLFIIICYSYYECIFYCNHHFKFILLP